MECPMTVPEYLSGLLSIREMAVGEMIRFGDSVRRLARAFGVPYVLKRHHSFGMLRAFPVELFRFAMEKTPSVANHEARHLLEEAAGRLETDGAYTVSQLAAIAREIGVCHSAARKDSPLSALGILLVPWRDQHLTDPRGREFTVKNHRTQRARVYQIIFEK